MKKKSWWLIFSWYLLPVAWMGVIFCFSNQPVLPGLEVFWQDFVLKKVAHIGVYAVLALAWWRATKETEVVTGKWKCKLAIILGACLLFAISDEWHQSFVPGRTATGRDVGFDMLGVTLAMLWSYRVI